MRDNDPVSDTPLNTAPFGFVPSDRQRTVLLAELELAGVTLGTYDHRIVDWLAKWDWPTVATIASLIRRAGRCPDCDRHCTVCACGTLAALTEHNDTGPRPDGAPL